MDARLVYWSWAFVNMIAVVVLAFEGVRRIRRRELVRHRQLMVACSSLVGLFVVSYALKVPLLGREDLATWGEASILMLRIHEVCVLVMLLSGAAAGVLAYRMRGLPAGTTRVAPPRVHRAHRAVGWAAVVASLLGVITAAFVLEGMYRRSVESGAAVEVRRPA